MEASLLGLLSKQVYLSLLQKPEHKRFLYFLKRPITERIIMNTMKQATPTEILATLLFLPPPGSKTDGMSTTPGNGVQCYSIQEPAMQ